MTEAVTVPVSAALFLAAALAEMGGGYLVWLWIRNRKVVLGALGAIVLFVYGIIPTFQPADFGRVYAAYGGIFIAASILWGRTVDKKRPDRFEIIGSLVAVAGAAIIFYSPR